MASLFRSMRAVKAVQTSMVAAVRPKPAIPAFRTFASTAMAKSSGPPQPQLYGPGGKSGEIPTDEEQSTGLERLELLGDLHGIDIFDMKPIEMTRMGTLDEPIPIFTLLPERIVGCTGYPADSHDTIWLTCNVEKEKHRCPECGCVYKLDYHGTPEALHGEHH